jgi:hypothetical protein
MKQGTLSSYYADRHKVLDILRIFISPSSGLAIFITSHDGRKLSKKDLFFWAAIFTRISLFKVIFPLLFHPWHVLWWFIPSVLSSSFLIEQRESGNSEE